MVPLGPLDLYAAGASIVNWIDAASAVACLARLLVTALTDWALCHGLSVAGSRTGGALDGALWRKEFIVLVVAVSAFGLDFGVP